MENKENKQNNNEVEKDNALTRQQKIENFLLNPDKEIYNSLEEFKEAIEYIKSLVGDLNLNDLEQLQGEDGKTPVLGIDFLTNEDLDKIDAYIQERINSSWSSYPSPEEINSKIENKVASEVAKIPRVKGDPGVPGKDGNDGSPDTAEQIIEKLRSLSKNKRLNVSDIRGLQAELNRIAQENESSVDEIRKLVESFKITIPAPGGSGGITNINGLIEEGANISITGSGTLADPFVINAVGMGLGDVVGPEGATDGNIPLYDGVTGKIIKNSTYSPSSFAPALTSDENYVTDAEKTAIGTISGKEDIANKTTSIPTDGTSDTKYPSAKAVKDYADGLVAGLLDYRGGYDASSGNYPTTGGSGVAGSVMKGDMWIISVAGTLGGEAVQVGDSIIANTDTPGQTASNWNHLNRNLSYVPEDIANKENTTLDTSTSKYPTNRLVKEYADAKVEDSIVDGHTTVAPSGNAVFDALALKLSLSGGTMTGNIQLGENTSIDLDGAGSADGKYSGIAIAGIAGATIAFGDLVYLASSGKWVLTDADASATGGPVGIGMCILGANDTEATKILLQGQIRADAKFPTLTVGSVVYLGETAGAIQTAIPTGADNVIRVVGFALTADEIYFNPSMDHQLTVA